jgi:hypothetical protein
MGKVIELAFPRASPLRDYQRTSECPELHSEKDQ